jgi:hypothetical protein
MSYLDNALSAAARRKWCRRAAFTFITGALMMGAAHAQSAFGWLELKPVPGVNLIQITGHALALEAVSGMNFTLSLRRQKAATTQARGNRAGSTLARENSRSCHRRPSMSRRVTNSRSSSRSWIMARRCRARSYPRSAPPAANAFTACLFDRRAKPLR